MEIDRIIFDRYSATRRALFHTGSCRYEKLDSIPVSVSWRRENDSFYARCAGCVECSVIPGRVGHDLGMYKEVLERIYHVFD